MLPEMIRTLSTMEKKTGTALTMAPGMQHVVEVVDLDQISAHHILGIRIRGFHGNSCLLLDANPAWFSLQDCEEFCDTTFDFMHRR